MIDLPNQPPSLLQGLALILGLPLLAVALGELIERCQRQKNPLAPVFQAIRNLVLPPAALWLVLRQFFQVGDRAIALRFLASLAGLAILYTLLLLLNLALTTGKKQRLWQIHLPNLLFQLLRAMLVLGLLAYVLANVWQVDLTKVMGALGIGSLVIALALQDTLSNLVSGFLLIVESPFKVGDWIQIGDLQGEVIEINWRAVRIKTLDRDIIIIPNGNLGKENICNYTLLDPLHAVRLRMPFSYEDDPDLIHKTLLAVALSVDGIQHQPSPEIDPQVYKNTHIEYEIRFFITNYSYFEKIEDEFWRRAYYAIRRQKFHFPFPDRIEYKLDSLPIDPDDTSEKLTEILRSQPIFATLDRAAIAHLRENAALERFGIGEQMIGPGTDPRAFYLLLGGQVSLSVSDARGGGQEISRLSQGDFLGEMALFPGETSPVAATVKETATAIKIVPGAIGHLIQHYPKFALEMSQFIDDRKKLIRLARGTEHSQRPTP
jgi:small-conductance mechanosensitive channel